MIEIRTLNPLHWVAIVLAAITGAVHLFLAVNFIPEILGWSFLLAGLGFFGGIGLTLINYRRPMLYLVGIVFTAVQIPLWWIINDITVADLMEPGIGITDKTVQVLLIVILIILHRRET